MLKNTRRVKFYVLTEVGSGFDGDHAVEILKKEASDWLEIKSEDVSYLWAEIGKAYHVKYGDRLVMVEDVSISQDEANITIKRAKEAIERGRQKEAERKEKLRLKKEQKKAQTLAEKKKLLENLKKELGET